MFSPAHTGEKQSCRLTARRPPPQSGGPMTTFNLPLLLGLLAACAVFMVMEFRGLKTPLSLNMKGDVKRETRWLAQYGQAVCSGVAAPLGWRAGPSPARGRKARRVVGTVAAVSVAAM